LSSKERLRLKRPKECKSKKKTRNMIRRIKRKRKRKMRRKIVKKRMIKRKRRKRKTKTIKRIRRKKSTRRMRNTKRSIKTIMKINNIMMKSLKKKSSPMKNKMILKIRKIK